MTGCLRLFGRLTLPYLESFISFGAHNSEEKGRGNEGQRKHRDCQITKFSRQNLLDSIDVDMQHMVKNEGYVRTGIGIFRQRVRPKTKLSRARRVLQNPIWFRSIPSISASENANF
jgi:hypothetical protein